MLIYIIVTNLRREVKHEDGKVENAEAGYYEVDDEVQRLAPDLDVEGKVRVGLGTAGVLFLVSLGGHLEDVPLNVDVILGEVHAVGHGVVARLGVDVHQVDLGPRFDAFSCCSQSVINKATLEPASELTSLKLLYVLCRKYNKRYIYTVFPDPD